MLFKGGNVIESLFGKNKGVDAVMEEFDHRFWHNGQVEGAMNEYGNDGAFEDGYLDRRRASHLEIDD